MGLFWVVLVGKDSDVENRVIDVPADLPPSRLTEASNFINANLRGLTIGELRTEMEKQIERAGAELDKLTAQLIEAGIAVWSGGSDEAKSLIVRGRSHLISDLTAEDDLHRIQQLFDDMKKFGVMQFTRSGRVAITKARRERLSEYLVKLDAKKTLAEQQ